MKTKKTTQNELFEAFSYLETFDDARCFLRDIATPAEIDAFAERWRIAQLLDAGGISYREIASQTGASTTTIARVARFLRNERFQGYRLVLDKRAGKRARK